MASTLSYTQIIKILESIAERHYMINSFFVGENHDANAADIVYPLLKVYPRLARFPQTNGEYKTIDIILNVQVLDRMQQNGDNETDVQNDTLRIFQDIVNEINQHPFYAHSNTSLVGDVEVGSIGEVYDDYLAGWECTLTLRIINNNSFCGLPFSELPGYSIAGPENANYSISWDYLTCATITGCSNLTQFITDYIDNNPSILNTTVQPGTNTYTGGTALHPTVNVSGGTVNNWNVTGGTLSSGGTNLYSIFLTAAQVSASTVSAGSNISVNNIGIDYTISTVASPSFNNITWSGTGTGNILSANTISASTINSGSTNLSSLFVNGINAGSNITLGGSSKYPTINVASSPSFNNITFSGTATGNILSANTISATTFYSGSTNLQSVLSNVSPSIANGLNTYTGTSGTLRTVNISAATLNNLTVTGNTILSSTTATTWNILNSGTTNVNISDYSNNIIRTGVTVSNIIGGTGNTINNDLRNVQIIGGNNITGTTTNHAYTYNFVVTGTSGGNLYATRIFSGNTDLSTLFGAGSYVQSVGATGNLSTGGTSTNPVISITSTPSFTTVSASTFVSGSTNLSSLFERSITAGNYLQKSGSTTLWLSGVPCDFSFAISDETTQITTGTSKLTFYAPYAFTLSEAQASLSQSGSTTINTFNIKKNGTTIFSTKLTIDINEFSTGTAATPAVITGGTIAKYDKITIDVDTIGTGSAGAKIYLIGTRSL